MKEAWMAELSALVDGEAVQDVGLLTEALSAADGREALLQLVRLRTAIRADDSRPGPEFYERVRPILVTASSRPPARLLRGLAAAVLVVLGTTGLVDLGLRLVGKKVPDRPPHATRVLRFEPGVDWQRTAR